MLDILFLGTGASVPSRDRALPCVAVRRGADIVLFDCGEGSQRQLMVSPYSFMKVRAVFVTHMHGDHFYGLPGLLQTMGMMGRDTKLIVRGPEGFADALRTSLALCEGDIDYELDIADMRPGDTQEVGDMRVTAFATEHGIPSQGYVLREPGSRGHINVRKAKKLGISGPDYSRLESGETVNGVRLEDVCSPPVPGRTLAYTGDTMKCRTLDDAVRGVDVLIHECTYMDRDRDLAKDHFHSTALSAAETARDAGAGALFLIHVSNRYHDRTEVGKEAGSVFENSYVPEDLAHYRIERSGIRKV